MHMLVPNLHHTAHYVDEYTYHVWCCYCYCRALFHRFGIGDLAFALGDDALAEFVIAVQFLPVCQMYISMCPEGTEGTTYAILTTLR
jgi:BT1 family